MRWWIVGVCLCLALVLVGGCAGPRWNSRSRMVSGEEFLGVYEQMEASRDQRLAELWRYGGSDEVFHYLEHWGGVTLTVPEYQYSIRARKIELQGWAPPRRSDEAAATLSK